jgi:hypothetical protein
MSISVFTVFTSGTVSAEKLGGNMPNITHTERSQWLRVGMVLAFVVAMSCFAYTANADAAGCFAKPSSCGYPDATNTGVPAGTSLTPSTSRTLSTNGQVVNGLEITGTVTVTADNVTIKNSKIVATKGGNGSYALILNNGADNFTIEHSEITGPAGNTNGIESAVWNHYGNPGVVAKNSYFHNCADCWEGPGIFENDYMVVNAAFSGSHNEDIYVCGGAVKVEHSTLLNTYHQTATVFGDTAGCGGNTFEVKNSLLAGGGFLVYPQANSNSSIGTMNVSNNRFARCLNGSNYDSQSGGTYCDTQTGDSNGYYPYGGFYGVAAYYFGGAGNVWNNNVWDDSSKPVCASGSAGCGVVTPPPTGSPAEEPPAEEPPAEEPPAEEPPAEEPPVEEPPAEEPPVEEPPAEEPPVEEPPHGGGGGQPPKTPLEAIVSLPEEILAEVPVILDGTGSTGSGNLSCSWSINGPSGSDHLSGCLATYTFTDPGDSSVKLTVRNGRSSDTARQTVNVLPSPSEEELEPPSNPSGGNGGNGGGNGNGNGNGISPVPHLAGKAAEAVAAVQGSTVPNPAPAPAATPDARVAWKAPARIHPRSRAKLVAAAGEGATCTWTITSSSAPKRAATRHGCATSLRAPARGTLLVRLTIHGADGATSTVRRTIRVA